MHMSSFYNLINFHYLSTLCNKQMCLLQIKKQKIISISETHQKPFPLYLQVIMQFPKGIVIQDFSIG